MACTAVATPLSRSAIAQLAGPRGFCVVHDWLPASSVRAVLADALACDQAGLSRRAAVGSMKHGNYGMNELVRSSSMCPLIPPPRPSAGNVDVRLALTHAVSSLREQLSAAPALQYLPSLEPFRTELSYLYYPVGGFYLRHLDVPTASNGWQPLGRCPADGGSFSGARDRREIVSTWDPNPSVSMRVVLSSPLLQLALFSQDQPSNPYWKVLLDLSEFRVGPCVGWSPAGLCTRERICKRVR